MLVAVFATLMADAVVASLTGGGNFLRGGLVPVALCVIIAWFTGYIVRQRRQYAVRLQDEAASKAVAEERLRIARELHDVVAHSMSVIAVQAGYGQYVIDTQPAGARNALGAIQATSREALDEMRRMLGALRPADQGLTAEGRGHRVRTDVSRSGTGRPGPAAFAHGERGCPGRRDTPRAAQRPPASVDLSAYRIVQEALTNVVKHAQTSSCQVLIGYGRDELILEVADNGPACRPWRARPWPSRAGTRPRTASAGTASSGCGSG